MRWWRHPIEAFLWWWRGYSQPGWRTRLLKPFLTPSARLKRPWMNVDESYEFRWVTREEWTRLMNSEEGWEWCNFHDVCDNLPGRKSGLAKRRLK